MRRNKRLATHWQQYCSSGLQRAQEIKDRLAQYLALDGKSLLDLGCGDGSLSRVFGDAGARVIGVDTAAARVQAAIRSVSHSSHPCGRTDFLLAAGESLPLQNASLDVVICNDVLEHVCDQAQTLEEIERVLKPNGWVYLAFPNRFSLQNLLRDPHYGLPAISILPRSMAAYCAVSVFKRVDTYEVGSYPIASGVLRILHSIGLEMVRWWPSPQRNLGFLTSLLHLYRFNTQPMVILLCQKRLL